MRTKQKRSTRTGSPDERVQVSARAIVHDEVEVARVLEGRTGGKRPVVCPHSTVQHRSPHRTCYHREGVDAKGKRTSTRGRVQHARRHTNTTPMGKMTKVTYIGYESMATRSHVLRRENSVNTRACEKKHPRHELRRDVNTKEQKRTRDVGNKAFQHEGMPTQHEGVSAQRHLTK